MTKVPAPPAHDSSYHLSEIHTPDTRPYWKRVSHTLSAFFRDFFYIIGHLPIFTRNIWHMRNPSVIRPEYCDPANASDLWKEKEGGLYVMLHGLMAYPCVWDDFIKQLQGIDSSAAICAPPVIRQGMCSIEEAVQPLLKMILEYVEEHPGKPICLIGHSNGGRLALVLNDYLQDLPNPIYLFSVAGATCGSIRMDQVKQIKPTQQALSKKLQEEMSYLNPVLRRLLDSLRMQNREAPDHQCFVATRDDFLVVPYGAALPNIQNEEEHHLYESYGHLSLLEKARKELFPKVIEWMQQQRDSVNHRGATELTEDM